MAIENNRLSNGTEFPWGILHIVYLPYIYNPKQYFTQNAEKCIGD